MMEDLIIVGAPGAFYWTGSVLVLNTTTGSKYAYVDDDNLVLYGSYLGYSVSAGHFTTPDSTEVVGGAPQNGQTGKAYVFQIQQESKVLKVIFQAKGKMLGSYFGASVCAADLNGDGLSDLLVGAPMYSTVREEGRVYVYMNVGEGKMEEAEFELMGSNLYSARFGEAIIDLGDIDDDGISDVAIGAPQEEDLQGAIYIYNGKRKGISQTFSQKITGSLMGNGFSMFGQSLSGGIDVDGNGYSDLVVGAYLSDSAVLLRARAIVIVETSLLLPPSFNRTKPIMCSENRQPAVCMNVTMCFRVKGRHIPGHIVFQYNVSADIKRNAEDLSRFYFVGGTNGTSGQKEVRDIYTPIHFEATYQIGNHIVNNSGHLPPLKPMLQQREGENNIVKNQTVFARYCAWANCSANLHVSASLVLPQSHENKQYFALGSGKTIILNVKLVNDGDDALLTVLHLRFPSNLYFIKVLDSVEKYISCEVAEEKRIVVGVDCTVGHYYVNSLSKVHNDAKQI
ncbi:ITA4 protein, partial [Amia calva]|nr:ITA4 protein [Amia calva]